MGYSNSPLAFDDARQILERALESPKGIKIPCETRGAAVSLRTRVNYFRTLDRKENKKVYENGHPMWGNSVYDRLLLRIPKKGAEDECVLYIEKHNIEKLRIEEITDD